MKRLATLIVLVQVGSSLWVVPSQVRGVKDWVKHWEGTKMVESNCKTQILLNAESAVVQCSDWPFETVKKILTDRGIN